jgi:protease II
VGYEGGRYAARLLAAPSTDGAAVPVSLAYRGDRVALDGTDPLLLEAYGAYGSSFDPEFSGGRWLRALCSCGCVLRVPAHVSVGLCACVWKGCEGQREAGRCWKLGGWYKVK